MPKLQCNTSVGIDLIPFVRQGSSVSKEDEAASSTSKAKKVRIKQDASVVRTFYETTVGLNDDTSNINVATSSVADDKNPSANMECSINRAKQNSALDVIKQESGSSYTSLDMDPELYFRLNNSLLRVAESGDDKAVKKALDNGADINGQDYYGWTALMCAAHSGQCKAVRTLLDSGAQSCIRNSKNHTAWDIAQIAKKKKVVHLLENYSTIVAKEKDCVQDSLTTVEPFFCDICGEDVTGVTQVKHNSSTVHRFNEGPKTNHYSFGIPEHNKGFQLMLKSGWDKGKGLGPEGMGQKYPVKTELKHDRKGLGDNKDNGKKRVTHFAANDLSAVKKSRQERDATLGKRAASKKARREKKIEMDFRRDFYAE